MSDYEVGDRIKTVAGHTYEMAGYTTDALVPAPVGATGTVDVVRSTNLGIVWDDREEDGTLNAYTYQVSRSAVQTVAP